MKSGIFVLIMLAIVACKESKEKEAVIKETVSKKWSAKMVDGKLVKDSLVEYDNTTYRANGVQKKYIDKLTGEIQESDSLILKKEGNKKIYITLQGDIKYIEEQKGDTTYFYVGYNLKEPIRYTVISDGKAKSTCTDFGDKLIFRIYSNMEVDKNNLFLKTDIEEYTESKDAQSDVERTAEKVKTTRYYIIEAETTYYE